MKDPTVETIVAQATPPGYAGVGVIRVSGPQSKNIAEIILHKIPLPRTASLLPFWNEEGAVIDEGIALFFPAPHSFTGEDVLELQGHSGPIVLDQLIKSILKAGARLARPGEFSERAFLNGKLDLVQAEAIADLIHASSEQAARSAMRSLQGEFSFLIHQLRDELINLRMMVEAAIDFPEEEIDFISSGTVTHSVNDLIGRLKQIIHTASQGALLREGIKVVIAGKPNAGKSSLLNCLSGRESAIVTEIPGTTRDILREHIHIDGVPLHIIDTAGLRDSEDIIEQEGIKRARKEMENADVILWLMDVRDFDRGSLETISEKFINKIPLVIILNKIDLLQEKPARKDYGGYGYSTIALSAKYNQGIDLLKEHLKELMHFKTTGEGIFIARRRHIDALQNTYQSLIDALHQLNHHQELELIAEDLRQAQQTLGKITGEFTSNDLLGKIFSTFCIGK